MFKSSRPQETQSNSSEQGYWNLCMLHTILNSQRKTYKYNVCREIVKGMSAVPGIRSVEIHKTKSSYYVLMYWDVLTYPPEEYWNFV
jgi:hypothetical protein